MRQSDGDSKLSPAEARLLLQKIADAEAAARKMNFTELFPSFDFRVPFVVLFGQNFGKRLFGPK